MHLDVRIGADDVDRTVADLTARGAKFLHTGQQGPHSWVTLADPEGNEFCVSPSAARRAGDRAISAGFRISIVPSPSSETYAWRPLGSSEMLVGALPVGTVPMTLLLAVSITETVLSSLLVV